MGIQLHSQTPALIGFPRVKSWHKQTPQKAVLTSHLLTIFSSILCMTLSCLVYSENIKVTIPQESDNSFQENMTTTGPEQHNETEERENSFYQDFLQQRESVLQRSQETADQSQVLVSTRLHRFSAYVDRFFADESYVQESQESRMRLSLVNFYQQHEDPSFRPRVSLSLALPNTENKWRLTLLSDDELENEQSSQVDATGTGSGDSNLLTSLGVNVRSDEKADIRFDAGVKFYTPVDPFVRTRIRRSFQLSTVELRLTETLQWRDSEGNTASTLMEVEYPISERYFFRSRSEIIYWDINSYWNPYQSFTFFEQLSPKSIIAYAIGINGQDEDDLHERSKDQVNAYWVEVRYRKNFYQNWLFYQVTPGLIRPREYDFDTLPRLELKLEAIFGHITK